MPDKTLSPSMAVDNKHASGKAPPLKKGAPFPTDLKKSLHPISPETKLPDKPHKGFDVESPERIEPGLFPDISVVKGVIYPMRTLRNVEHMLNFYGISANYDVIAKDTRVNIAGLKSCPDSYDNTALTTLSSFATLNGIYSGQFISQVFAIASKNPVNPALDMVTSQTWDGEDRLPSLYATITVKEDFPESLKEILIHKWLLSAIAAICMPTGFSSRGVIVL